MTQKLLDHFKRMQEMATAFIMPESYTDHEGTVHEADEDRVNAFGGDMIYMLDGPEQRAAQAQAELVVSQGYPTEDAYMAVNRALHWRTEQLRQAGIEPLDLSKLHWEGDGRVLPHYPPESFRFPITEAFRGDDHRQLYHSWRRYPRAMRITMFMGFIVGAIVPTLVLVFRL